MRSLWLTRTVPPFPGRAPLISASIVTRSPVMETGRTLSRTASRLVRFEEHDAIAVDPFDRDHEPHRGADVRGRAHDRARHLFSLEGQEKPPVRVAEYLEQARSLVGEAHLPRGRHRWPSRPRGVGRKLQDRLAVRRDRGEPGVEMNLHGPAARPPRNDEVEGGRLRWADLRFANDPRRLRATPLHGQRLDPQGHVGFEVDCGGCPGRRAPRHGERKHDPGEGQGSVSSPHVAHRLRKLFWPDATMLQAERLNSHWIPGDWMKVSRGTTNVSESTSRL